MREGALDSEVPFAERRCLDIASAP
jgi:hypothetical protein